MPFAAKGMGDERFTLEVKPPMRDRMGVARRGDVYRPARVIAAEGQQKSILCVLLRSRSRRLPIGI